VTPVNPPRYAERLRAALGPAWDDWRIGIGVAVAAAGVHGLVAGWWTPRGPITAFEALATIVISLLVGVFAGVVMRSRWVMLLAPVAFVVVFELARMGTVGPLVDGIRPGSPFGILAFALGRGLHGLLALVPLLLGAALGAAKARRLGDGLGGSGRARHGWARVGLWARRSVTALVIVGLVVLSLAIVRPERTDPILAADGEPLAGSVAELTRVEVGGHDLAMMIRGDSVDKPVLLFLAGGPGGTEMGAMRRHGQALERDFVVATFDQRGTGKSYDDLDPTSTLTLDGAVSDAVGVTNYLRERFHQDKIYVVGQSWGTILGVLAVQQHPELYRAYIGTGQMVSVRETDRIFYRDTLAWARRTGNTGLVDKLTASGPPPYTDFLNYEAALTNDPEVYPYDHSRNSEGAGGFSENLFVEEYSLMEQLHNLGAFMDVFTVLYPQLQDIDFRTDAAELEVPVYLVQGRHEAPGRARPAEEWFRMLDAPKKQLIFLDTSGHRPLFEQPELFHQVMTETVLSET
jgi:proline iminopeptidase